MKNNMKQCYFCTNGFKYIDYKEVDMLKKFMSQHSSMIKSGKTGVCALHQKKLATAIKRARHLALVPFVSR